MKILYCHCAYARIIPEEVKQEVLRRLLASGVAFESVSDLCEMSARQDPSLKRLAEGEGLRIAACYPRAVRWLFSAGKAPLPDGAVQVLNMRTGSAENVVDALLEGSSGKGDAE